MKKVTVLAALILAILNAPVSADESTAWTVRPERIDHPPIIDGRLTDAVWQKAPVIDNFTQQDPDLGQPSSERTEVRLLYTSTHLYIGIIFFDKEPDKISRNIFDRDGPIFQDDSMIIAIDANNDNRTAVQLAVNPNGARLDREITEGGSFNTDFDFHWRLATSLDERGAIFELEIPFGALSFQPAEEYEMGLLFRRQIPRKNERSYWPALSRDFNYTNVSHYGRMVGLKDLDLGRNLEIAPSIIAGGTQSPGSDDFHSDASFDARWGITPNMILDVTANTDFAQVESDALRVNLTRFSLFFPEKREFFLENSNLFQFGSPNETEIFFSRRIGIFQGQEVPILGGVRLNGHVGDTNVGFLSMQTDSTDAIDGENFTVGRIKQNFLSRSTVGAILTRRTGFDDLEDTTVGFDFQHVWGSSNTVFADVAKSDRSTFDDGQWFFNGGYILSSDHFDADITYLDVGENFSPGIGFVRRPDQRRLRGSISYKPRPDWDSVRQIRYFSGYSRVENHDSILESELLRLQQDVFFESNDTFTIEYTHDFDLITVPFQIAPDVIIPPGEYRFNRYRVEFDTDDSRVIDSEVGFQWGSFYGGEIRSFYSFFLWKAAPRFHIEWFNELNHVELPGGTFDSNVFGLLTSYFFSPDLNIRVASQYSSLDESLIFNMRLRWIFGQGSEAWLVYDEDHNFGLPFDSLRNRAIIGKFVYRFRM